MSEEEFYFFVSQMSMIENTKTNKIKAKLVLYAICFAKERHCWTQQ